MTVQQLDGDAMTEPTAGLGSNGRTVNRRHVLGVGAGLGATLLAGCTGGDSGSNSDGGDETDDGSTAGATAGTFRLLISDQPVAIDEFDSLDVSFDRARIFRDEADEDEDDDSTNESETDETNRTETNETETDETETSGSNDEEEAESDEDGEGGFSTIDLDGATVDLTQVVGDKAIGVFEGELEAGQYSKIELYASDVEGIVDGETVDVKIPSGKLQIVKPFEITPDEPVSFVFDINVVKKGPNGYNLLPVISESGVAGKDVEVEEVGGDGEDGGDEAMNGTDGGTNERNGDSSDGSETASNETETDGGDANSTDTGGNETTGSEQ